MSGDDHPGGFFSGPHVITVSAVSPDQPVPEALATRSAVYGPFDSFDAAADWSNEHLDAVLEGWGLSRDTGEWHSGAVALTPSEAVPTLVG